MPSRNVLVLGVAVFLGLIAVYVANAYFSARQQIQEQAARKAMMAHIVVASQNIAFGEPIATQDVRLASWPVDSVPAGAFTNIAAATQNRAALRPIVAGEPLLASKVSGPDGRATIASNLPKGMLAFAVPVNDQTGVGGFVRPGDAVDVLVTHQSPGNSANGDKMTDVLLQGVRVIGIDQISDENKTQPAIGKTATLEVDTLSAQKLALATQTSTLSLALRNVADQTLAPHQTVTSHDLGGHDLGGHDLAGERLTAPAPAALHRPAPRLARRMAHGPASGEFSLFPASSMVIVRGTKLMEYEVRHGE